MYPPKKNSTQLLGIAAFFALLSESATADSLKMKNGDAFSGSIISLQDGLCIFATNYGTPINVKTSEVHALATDNAYTVVFKNGDKATGSFHMDPTGRTVLESDSFGSTVLLPEKIQSLTRIFSAPTPQDRHSSAEHQATYGAEQDQQAPVDFLTGSAVLLSPGTYEIDVGLSYKHSVTQYNLSEVGYFQKSSYSARLLQLQNTFRAGITAGLEGYLALPVTYTRIDDVSSNEYVRHTGAWDLADIGLGLQYQLVDERSSVPALALTVDITAPTGKKKYNDALNDWKDPLNNGLGHWSLAPGIAFVRTTDPAVIFGGMSYQYMFKQEISGYDVQPGSVFKTYLGLGFALNEKLSLGTRLSYAHAANLKAEDEEIHGSDTDPLDISFNASYRLSENWVASPQVTFGLNDAAGPAALAIDFKRRFN
ncbi:transporter [Pseudomonas sp. UBA6562]|uniref:transporter n=1 Tax=Pseudomonas sp. UBA6562 TaxID=1947332 RepID=UPI0025F6396E|nr:transporter [Pseudomonas sp. UBA6562]